LIRDNRNINLTNQLTDILYNKIKEQCIDENNKLNYERIIISIMDLLNNLHKNFFLKKTYYENYLNYSLANDDYIILYVRIYTHDRLLLLNKAINNQRYKLECFYTIYHIKENNIDINDDIIDLLYYECKNDTENNMSICKT